MPSVLLVRHGQASFGSADYDVLSSLGHRQAELVAERLTSLPARIETVRTGSMRRQRETAAPLVARLGVDAHEDARFDEYDHEALVGAAAAADPGGLLDGAPDLATYLERAAEPARAFQAILERALAAWVGGADDGATESFSAFRQRVRDGLAEVVDATPSGTTAVVVTSGGVIAAAVADALALPDEGWGRVNTVVVNSAITRLVVGRRGTTLVAVNDHAHLESDPGLISYR